MNEYSDMSVKKGTEAASGEFYKNRNVWITKLDEYGCIMVQMPISHTVTLQ